MYIYRGNNLEDTQEKYLSYHPQLCLKYVIEIVINFNKYI